MNLEFKDFKIVPDLTSVVRRDISDEVYFSKKYSAYTSNSRLKNIDPKEGGSPQLYLQNPHTSSTSLSIGSAVHEVLLQPEEFVLAPKMGRPTAKLGDVIDTIWDFRQKGETIYSAIHKACNKVGYFVNMIDKKIPMIIEKGLPYYLEMSKRRWKKVGVEEIFLSDADYDKVTGCLESCYNNPQIMNKLKPTDIFENPIPSYNEDAIMIDFLVTYEPENKFVRIPFKLKIDNWTIDEDAKKITLNDLKTTGHPVNWFMNEEYGSFFKYHYYRQLAVYSKVLWYYCQYKYGVSLEAGWTMDCNILAVQTLPDFSSRCFSIRKNHLKMGEEEFEQLMKRIAAAELFGYETEFEFV